MSRVLGFDISLNHGAAVGLVSGKMELFRYYTDIAGSAARSKFGHRLEVPKGDDRQLKQAARLAWVEAWLKAAIRDFKPDFVGIEDYALRAEQGAHQLGEVGGTGRLICWHAGVRYRLHDPISVKMFVTWDGTAQKDSVEESVQERWGHDFSDFNPPPPKNSKHKQSRKTSEDLADAFGVAKLVDTERLIRAGTLRLDELEHDKERQVFNRVTKTYPVSLIGREWIHNPKGRIDGVEARLKKALKAAKKSPKLYKFLKQIAGVAA